MEKINRFLMKFQITKLHYGNVSAFNVGFYVYYMFTTILNTLLRHWGILFLKS